jgi:hypothetical protein
LQANFLRSVSIKIPLDTACLCHFEARNRRVTPCLRSGRQKEARGDSPTLSCRAIARHPSPQSERHPQGETPRFARGDKKYRSGCQPFLCHFERSEKSSSLTIEVPSTYASGRQNRGSGRQPNPVFPRHASAEGPLTSFGATEKRKARDDAS